MSETKRRRWTAAGKLRVVLAGLDGSVEISELCRRVGGQPDAVLWLDEAAALFGGEGFRRWRGVEAEGERATYEVGAASGEGSPVARQLFERGRGLSSK